MQQGSRDIAGFSVYQLNEWRSLQPYLARVSARLVPSTEHGVIYLIWIGLLALVVTQHRDVQALEGFGEGNWNRDRRAGQA